MREPSQIHDARKGAASDEWDEELTDYRVQCLIQIIVAALLLAVMIGLVVNMTKW